MYTLAVTGVVHANTACSANLHVHVQKVVYAWFTVQHLQHGGFPMWRPVIPRVETGQAQGVASCRTRIFPGYQRLTVECIGRYNAEELTVTKTSGGGGENIVWE